MDLPSGLRLTFKDNPSWADRKIVDDGLGAYNAPFLADSRYSYFGFFVRDGSDKVRAGLIGNCYAGWLFINLLWIEDELRQLGLPVVPPGERLSQVRDAVTSLRELDGPDFQTPVVMAVRGPKARAPTGHNSSLRLSISLSSLVTAAGSVCR